MFSLCWTPPGKQFSGPGDLRSRISPAARTKFGDPRVRERAFLEFPELHRGSGHAFGIQGQGSRGNEDGKSCEDSDKCRARVADNWHIEDNLTLQQQLGQVAK